MIRFIAFIIFCCIIASFCSCSSSTGDDSYDAGRWNEKMRWTIYMQDSVKPRLFDLKIKLLLRDISNQELQYKIDTIYYMVDRKFSQP